MFLNTPFQLPALLKLGHEKHSYGVSAKLSSHLADFEVVKFISAVDVKANLKQ